MTTKTPDQIEIARLQGIVREAIRAYRRTGDLCTAAALQDPGTSQTWSVLAADAFGRAQYLQDLLGDVPVADDVEASR